MNDFERKVVNKQSQEKDPILEARNRLWDLKGKEETEESETYHFAKVNISELPDEDILFFLELEKGRLNTTSVTDQIKKLKAEDASESRLEFIAYIANQVELTEFDRRL